MAITTSLKLSDELRERAALVARAQNLTPHAFMVQAIELAATAAEQRQAFVASALDSRREFQESGAAFAAEDVHAYLRAKVNGQSVAKPEAKSWRK